MTCMYGHPMTNQQETGRQNDATARNGGLALWVLLTLGIVAAIMLGSAVAYLQAEVLTAPGEPVWSTLTSTQMLEIVRSSTFALGAIGGVAALLLAYRRQKLNQASHNHELDKHRHERQKDKSSHELELDKQLSARLAGLHDRYTKSVEQLANDSASIRLGAVHAIEALAADWLAIDNHRQRQVCVNLLCSYLNSLDQPRDEGSIQNILAEDPDANEDELRTESAAAGKRLWEDKTVRKAILEVLSDMLVADHTANRAPVTVDLRGVALGNGLDLQRARLARLPLINSHLGGRTLTGANLTGANLSGAMLYGASLDSTDLTDAVLTDAWCDKHTSLRGANLTRAQMQDANMRETFLYSANLTDANLSSADLREADLREANLKGAECDGTILRDANLRQAKLIGTRLRTAKMGGADLTEADLTGAHLPVVCAPKHVLGTILTRGCWTLTLTIPSEEEWSNEAHNLFGDKRIQIIVVDDPSSV